MNKILLAILAIIILTGTAQADDSYFFVRLGLQHTNYNFEDEVFADSEDDTQADVSLGWVKPIGKSGFHFDVNISHESFPGRGGTLGGNGDSELTQNRYGIGLEYRF